MNVLGRRPDINVARNPPGDGLVRFESMVLILRAPGLQGIHYDLGAGETGFYITPVLV